MLGRCEPVTYISIVANPEHFYVGYIGNHSEMSDNMRD